MKIFIVLTCLVAFVVADSAEKNPICQKNLTVRPIDCCPTLPNLHKFFDTCKDACNKSSSTELPTTTAAATKGGKKGEKKQNEKKEIGEKDKGKGNNWNCMVTCVIKSASIGDSDGKISKDLLSQLLLSGAASEWIQIISNVVSSCFDNTTAMPTEHRDEKGHKKAGNKSSDVSSNVNPINGMILKCVYKNTYLQCPSPVDSAECKDLSEKISQCPCKHGEKSEKGEPNNKPKIPEKSKDKVEESKNKGKQQGEKEQKESQKRDSKPTKPQQKNEKIKQ